MLQDHPIDWDLHIVVDQGKGKIEKNWDLIKDGEEHGKGTPQCKMDEREEKD
jgi:hypothetical protein